MGDMVKSVRARGTREEMRKGRAGGGEKGELVTITFKFSFHPRNPGTPRSVKTVNRNMPQIRKVTTTGQV